MQTEEEYRNIGKAVIDECLARADERCITITLRSAQFNGKLYILMEDGHVPISTWMYVDLMAVSSVNRIQRARERAEEVINKIRRTERPVGLPREVKGL